MRRDGGALSACTKAQDMPETHATSTIRGPSTEVAGVMEHDRERTPQATAEAVRRSALADPASPTGPCPICQQETPWDWDQLGQLYGAKPDLLLWRCRQCLTVVAFAEKAPRRITWALP